MSDLIKRQFEFTRRAILKDIESGSGKNFDVQPEGFNNTVQWQLGHVLVTAENLLFGPSGKLPEEYGRLFGNGSKPSAWEGDAPSVATLVEQLKEQLNRIKELPDDRFDEKLPEPVIGNRTYGQLVSFTAFHEANHCGQIHAMVRFLG
ncbi:MAG TPA: DinB family protein [Bacillales bacterium]|nr:DinB family protein [Bacillales bacterium]